VHGPPVAWQTIAVTWYASPGAGTRLDVIR
jgi:hypothetical protein